MSAGGPIVDSDLGKLAPRFRDAVEASLAACARAGFDAVVWEALRSNELQYFYWLRGRPPTAEYPAPVTYAKSSLYSWHGYGLAVDVISKSRRWFAPLIVAGVDEAALAIERERARAEGERWFRGVADIFKQHGCDWGGDWKRPHADPPHMQWGRLKATPSDRARALYREGGLEAVWRAVGAA